MGPEYFWVGGMWIFPLIMIVVMLIVVYLIFGRGRMSPPWYEGNNHYQKNDSSSSALDIIKQRYAKGDINKDEFEQIKKDLI